MTVAPSAAPADGRDIVVVLMVMVGARRGRNARGQTAQRLVELRLDRGERRVRAAGVGPTGSVDAPTLAVRSQDHLRVSREILVDLDHATAQMPGAPALRCHRHLRR